MAGKTPLQTNYLLGSAIQNLAQLLPIQLAVILIDEMGLYAPYCHLGILPAEAFNGDG